MYQANIRYPFSKYFIIAGNKKLITILSALFIVLKLQAQVGIGITNPDPSAILHVQATDKGMLVPRMFSSQRLAIVNPAEGLLVYQMNDESKGFWYFTNGHWKSLNALNDGGLHTIYISDDITDAEAAAKIAAEYGPNTQEIRIVGCTNLTTLDLSMATKLGEVFIYGNPVLQSVNLSNLQILEGGMYIRDCPALTTMPAPQVRKLGRSENGGFSLSVTYSGITSISLPSLTVLSATLDIENNNALVSVNIPLITRHGYGNPSSGTATIANNHALTSISFAALQSAYFLRLGDNHSLTTLNFPALTTVSYSMSVEKTASLAAISFPALTTIAALYISNDTALTSLSVPLLNTIAGLAFGSNNAITSVSFPSLVTCTSFSIENCASLSTLSVPLLTSAYLNIGGNNALASLSFPSLTTIAYPVATTSDCIINNNANLVSISMDNVVNYSGANLWFDHNKLPSSQINYLLHKFVGFTPMLTMKSIYLKQTPFAPPAGQGLIDKATLAANGNNVETD